MRSKNLPKNFRATGDLRKTIPPHKMGRGAGGKSMLRALGGNGALGKTLRKNFVRRGWAAASGGPPTE
jgi:hypothetical protein